MAKKLSLQGIGEVVGSNPTTRSTFYCCTTVLN
jgi:hypothetical protein